MADGVSAVLTTDEIRSSIEDGWLISKDTFQPSNLSWCSYDVRAGAKAILGGLGKEIDLRQEILELGPGSFAGIISLEKFLLPDDVFAQIGSKRIFSYEGVILLTGSLIDPGYQGHLVFGVYNASQKRVLIRAGRKICNVVFHRVSQPAREKAGSDPDLLNGDFPDDFLNKMANMEVLPWQQISDRVRQIEQITSDIVDLKARYDDVLEPIRRLTENVNELSAATKSITKDIDDLRSMVSENTRQIAQLTTGLTTLGGQIGGVQEHGKSVEELIRTEATRVTRLEGRFGRYELAVIIFWALFLVAITVLATIFVPKLFGL